MGKNASLSEKAWNLSVEGGEGPQRLRRYREAYRLTLKFYRAAATDAAVKGAGLGMTIVKAIIEANGGRVWVESERGKGTTACFTLLLA